MWPVLYEDNHLLVVNKPAGLVTMGAGGDRESLVDQARDYLKRRYHKPGNVYVGVVSRLDAAASGALVLARTSKAAARLSEAFRKREVEKSYWAIVAGQVEPAHGTLESWLLHDDRQQRVLSVDRQTPAAQHALLDYQTLRKLPRATLLGVRLHSGRKHQIRVQLAERGWTILGDRKYGSTALWPQGIALHSRRLGLRHPVRDQWLEWVAPPPDHWLTYGVPADVDGAIGESPPT